METLKLYIAASWDHFLAALFLGFVPIVVITTMVAVLAFITFPRRELFKFSVTFSVLGGALGLLLGASREPVVQAFLPAIITLISGLLVLVFPKTPAGAALMASPRTGQPDPDRLPRIILVSLAALLLASTTAAFWGGSIRGIREQDDRRYAEWLKRYEEVRLPLELEAGRAQSGLAPATQAADAE